MVYQRKRGPRSPEMEAIVARIEQVRKQQELGRVEFARRIGLPVQTYSNYVTGQGSDPSVELLLGVMRAFGVSANWILQGDETVYPVDPPAGLGARA